MDTPVIALLTDFGLDDPYVGQMKGVLADQAAMARVIDLSHGVEPYRIAQAGFFARASGPHFPAGTTFVCVVDPGVGSERRVVLLAWRERFFLAPDNGLLSLFLADTAEPLTAYNVTPSVRPASATFHGRDLFAPIAARLAHGEAPSSLGQELDPATLVRAEWAVPSEEGGRIHASVLHADRFGNLVLNLSEAEWSERLPMGTPLRIQAGSGKTVGFGKPGPSRAPARVVTHYAELASGEIGLLAGSQGYLELAMNQAPARKALSAGPEAEIILELRSRSR